MNASDAAFRSDGVQPQVGDPIPMFCAACGKPHPGFDATAARSTTLAARLWWATLPFYGWVPTTVDDVLDGACPAPWYAYPLAWIHRVAERLPGCFPVFEPMPPVVPTAATSV